MTKGGIYLLITLFLVKLIRSHVNILSPFELIKQFEHPIKASYSTFGNIPYGFYLTGRIYYDMENKEEDYACRPLTGINLQPDDNLDRSPIVLVDRGRCTYVTKTRNVQNIGGHLALIINNVPGSIENTFMNDDGTGSDLIIPAVLISKEDGDKIKKFLMENKNDNSVLSNVLVSVEYMIAQSEKSNLQIFFSSSNTNIYKLIKGYLPYHKLISDKVEFTPHYISHESPFYTLNHTIKSEHCLSNGKYCAQPRYDVGATNGKDILLEDIRQKCIYLISLGKFSKEEANPLLYWNYMVNFYDNCISNKKFNAECSYETSEDLGVSQDIINQCMMQSFNVESYDNMTFNNTNSLLEKDRDIKENYKIKIFPTILVNNKTIYGAWTYENIFEAVCSGFINKPNECNLLINQKDKGKQHLSFKSIVVIIIILIIINVTIIWLCLKYIVRRIKLNVESASINGRINNVVSSYLALREGH